MSSTLSLVVLKNYIFNHSMKLVHDTIHLCGVDPRPCDHGPDSQDARRARIYETLLDDTERGHEWQDNLEHWDTIPSQLNPRDLYSGYLDPIDSLDRGSRLCRVLEEKATEVVSDAQAFIKSIRSLVWAVETIKTLDEWHSKKRSILLSYLGNRGVSSAFPSLQLECLLGMSLQSLTELLIAVGSKDRDMTRLNAKITALSAAGLTIPIIISGNDSLPNLPKEDTEGRFAEKATDLWSQAREAVSKRQAALDDILIKLVLDGEPLEGERGSV